MSLWILNRRGPTGRGPAARWTAAIALIFLLVGCEAEQPAPTEPPTQLTVVVSGGSISDRFIDAFDGPVRSFTLPAENSAALSTQADALAALLRDSDAVLSVVATGSGTDVALLGVARSGLELERLVLLNADDGELPAALLAKIQTVQRITAGRPGSAADIIVAPGFGYTHPAVAERIDADGEHFGEHFGKPLILTGQPAGPGWQLTRVTVDGAGWVRVGEWESEIGDTNAFTPNLNFPAGTQVPVIPHRVRRLLTDVELATSTLDIGTERPVSEVSGDGWAVKFEWRAVEFR